MDRTLVLDISSDDEVGFEDSSIADNFDWVWSFLEDSPCGDDVNCNNDDNNGGVLDNGDESDDVVVVGEALSKPMRAKTSVPRCGNGDDDDCVVLDCDPNKPRTVDAKGSVGDSDDLLIVGEKGQVACRDYPHSRHSCAKFPFSSTPHERCCDLCHCYVCDSLAPCAYWDSGDSSIAHCHATDKEVYWQRERKKVRQSKNTPVPITKQPVATMARLHRPVPRAASSFGVPNIISQGRNPRPGISVAWNRYQPHLVTQQLLRTCNSNTNTQNNRVSTLDTNLVSSHSIYKRSRFTARPVGANQSFHNPPNNVSVAYLHQLLNHQLVGKPIENGSITFTESSPHLNINAAVTSDSPYVYTSANQTQNSEQPSVATENVSGSIFLGDAFNMPSSITERSLQPSEATTHNVSSQSLPCYTSNSLNNVAQSCQQPPAENSKVQHRAFNSLNNVAQSCQQPSVATESVSGSIFPGDASNMPSSITERSQQPSEATTLNVSGSLNNIALSCQQPSAENSKIQHRVFNSLNNVAQNIEQPSADDFDIDTWLSDNGPILGAEEGSYWYDMNNQPSVTVPVDTGMLYFDFESS